jgi:hypothetical protein
MRVLFPSSGLYLICNTGTASGPNYPNKLIYDLNKIPIKRWLELPVNYASSTLIVPSATSINMII